MATQGLLSITRRGQVAIKIITGSNGFNIPKLADSLREQPTLNVLELFERCSKFDVGDHASLVIQTGPEKCYMNRREVPRGQMAARYACHFRDPKFNPRWDEGSAAYSEIVELTPTSRDIKTCFDCVHAAVSNLSTTMPGTLSCRKHAPTVVPDIRTALNVTGSPRIDTRLHTVWPVVNESDWCSEFEPAQPPSTV